MHSWRKAAGGTRIDEDGVTTGVLANRRLCRWEEIRAVTTVRTGSGPSATSSSSYARTAVPCGRPQAPVDLAENPDHRFRRAHAVVRSTWEERCAGGTP
ncbi:PH domain-containing protein OS=Streptomyces microflavus OX=1919 GN=Smic_13880 PE=4 SV=1 [Streptomyces microflavus]